MSVLIEGMEMPKSCGDCPIGDSLCCSLMPGVPALWKEYTIAVRTNRRHSDCPLVEVPEDVQPVKHAAWDYAMPVDGPERNRYRCSRCSGFALLDYWGNDVRSRYCPECGAIMDDEGKKYWVQYDGELTPAEDSET